MQCRGCGKEIPKGNLFCNYCGLKSEPAKTVLPQKTRVFEEKSRSLHASKSELQNTSKERFVQKEDSSKEGSVQKVVSSKERSVRKEDSSEKGYTGKEDSSKERSVQKEDRSKERSVQKEDSSKERSVQKEDSSKEGFAQKEDSSKERSVQKEDSSNERSARKDDSSIERSVQKKDSSKERSVQKENLKNRIQQALLEGVAVVLAIAILTIILYIYPDMKAFFFDRPNQESAQVNAKNDDIGNVEEGSEQGLGSQAPQEQDGDDYGMAYNTEDNDNKETVTTPGDTNTDTTTPEENVNPNNIIDYYEFYIEGRDKEYISPDLYHFIENHLEFNLEGMECKDIGNETMEVKVKLYLMEAAYEDLYVNDYDILLLPMASTLAPIGDARTASLVLNELGNEVAFPISLKGYGKRYFELFFYVSDKAKELAVYVTNTSNGDGDGSVPVYEIVYHME